MNDKERAILNAYLAWVRTNPDHYKRRLETWETYVALRDGKEPPRRENENHKDQGQEETQFREVSFTGSARRRFMQ